ncbi:hypothetical protein TrCOL_g1854 [Triparma columacea]|uniref:Cytochrome b5 heme-binding domain-containing protein n=1 Tax=Triparma columacea TaxID=722753 RepID=A0A9W7G3X6_9STRA|nr:hypothetical protein TrCOL_g1854 [Triparma columacea]
MGADKSYSSAEVAKHNTEEDCWLIISPPGATTPNVYNVTKYLDEHPGGAEVLLDAAGMDATDQFEDIGHSGDARKELAKYVIGELKITEEEKKKMEEERLAKEAAKAAGGGMGPIIAILVVLLAVAGYFMTQ